MKHILITTMTAAFLAQPVLAEDPAPPAAGEDDGFSLMEEGAKLFFKGIMQQMEPALDDLQQLTEDMEPALRQFAKEMGPALRDLMEKVDDITLYHPPELLPNGDIILRRKQPMPPEPLPVPDPNEGEIDL
ncbi:hypothetical protein TG4357_01048 [Thalassovita gelatinovora]|uniref:AAA+ family ATPase n=1 Tax=Thalassovita gelatinovora TaxID=53501 RepID=A0A0P1FTG2_THAGE|nr:hypothetical protein [Thalassovita gelatinovora]QIZ80215.1 hypothetical protein HFZ77_06895 [Thalassovita gelatinovora]CUH64068.1 hypothetical protein TG4357_01048 [Thalassovita gelatinovora]SEQ82631.1 hypothetical protein SAMN04488043_10989 [Thalassovita gelatinovora]